MEIRKSASTTCSDTRQSWARQLDEEDYVVGDHDLIGVRHTLEGSSSFVLTERLR